MRPRGAPRRLRRVERRVSEDILEQVAHALKMGRKRRSCNAARARRSCSGVPFRG
jgi:hypothetical protein